MNTTLSEVLRAYIQLSWTDASCRLLIHNNYVFTGNASKDLFSVSPYYDSIPPLPPPDFNLSFFDFYYLVGAKMDSLEYEGI